MAVKFNFTIILYKILSRVRLLKKLGRVIVKTLFFLQSLLFATMAISGETASNSAIQVDEESVSGNLSIIRLSTDQLPNEFGILNNTGIIGETNFAKDLESSNQNDSFAPAGFTNKITFTSSVDYDTNPALDNSRKKSVWIYTFIPQALLEYTNEINRFYLDAALVVQRPSNEEILPDRNDPRLTLGWARTYEAGSYGLYASYLQFLSRAQEIRTTGVFNNNANSDSTQKTRVLGANWEHKFAQKWNLLTNADYTQESFSGGVNLIGSKTLGVKSKLNYEYTERLDTYTQIGYVKIQPDNPFEDADLVRFALGADYLISSSLKASLRAGQYNISGAQSESSWEAGLRLAYEADRIGYYSELNREVNSAGGLGGFQKTDTFRLGFLYNISEKDNVGANYSFAKFKEDVELGLPKQDFQQVDLAYNRLLTAKWNARANIIYRELNADSRNQGLIVGVSLVYDGLSF